MKSVATFFHVESTNAAMSAIRVFVAVARFPWPLYATVAGSRKIYHATIEATRRCHTTMAKLRKQKPLILATSSRRVRFGAHLIARIHAIALLTVESTNVKSRVIRKTMTRLIAHFRQTSSHTALVGRRH